jgi:hypothetical protein
MRLYFAVFLTLIISFSPAVYAHHSDAGIDESRVVVLEGKVKALRWRQPHVYLSIETTTGEPENWDIQLVAINVLARRGWSRDSLKEGDAVIVHVFPAEDGRTHGKLETITFADGTPVAVDPEAAQTARVPAESMHGQWSGQNPGQAVKSLSVLPPLPPIDPNDGRDRSCSGGFDCSFIENLVLTDAAWAAREAYDPLSSDNPETTCTGRPTPAALASAKGYMQDWDLSQQEEKILIRSEWFNELRTVWMDGRSHPDPSQTFATGHSIGYWVGDTLVVDTRNFDDHRSPYQIGVPSGSQKHVIERYTLSEDRTYMQVEFMLEDPEYIARPYIRTGNLFYAPDETMYASDCDIENTSRFAPLD